MPEMWLLRPYTSELYFPKFHTQNHTELSFITVPVMRGCSVLGYEYAAQPQKVGFKGNSLFLVQFCFTTGFNE